MKIRSLPGSSREEAGGGKSACIVFDGPDSFQVKGWGLSFLSSFAADRRNNASMLWETVKKTLSAALPESEFSLWITPIACVRETNQVLELACPDRLFCAWIRDRYLKLIEASLSSLTGSPPAVSLTVAAAPQQERNGSGQLRLPGMSTFKASVRSLHPGYTFEQFMVGQSNLMARAACRAIADADMSFGSSLFLTSGTGLGKSHLTQAVVHQVMRSAPQTRLHYLTAQQFSAEMVKCIRENSMEQFSGKFIQGCDLLLIEDVHTLSGKTKTQEELNNILDYLIKAGKRVILTSAVAPRALSGVDEDFRSRMSSGLVTDIKAPDYSTRSAIIRHKAALGSLPLGDEHVHLLAEHLQGDIRRIESALLGLRAKASLCNAQPDMDMVREVLEGLVSMEQEKSKRLSGESIREVVSSQFRVSVDELLSRSRKQAVSFPRQIGMYLTRKYTEESLANIGSLYNRDHSTVLYAIKTVSRDIVQKSSVRQQVEMLTDKLGA
ncbi:chromosomal replication initiator protein DnaA [Candidatus Electronema sp. JC]|uniref:chromosomal replication initiator protein DnaA n=1 Tax=Candidatus Electronema sp. JC TaxID=3401570 RepID=UPI003B429AA3